MDNQDLLRYSRHILLKEIDYSGQEKLRQAQVLLIGVGGVGSPCAMYLAGAGVGKLIIVDNDKVEQSNLQRQILYNEKDLGKNKVDCAQTQLQKVNSGCNIEIINETINQNNLPQLIKNVDIVLDATDRFATRHIINHVCVSAQKPLLIASAIRFDAQLLMVQPENKTACYECLYPIANGALEEVCSTMGVFSPATGIVGTMLASETLKFILRLPTLQNEVLILNFLANDIQKFKINRRHDCVVCGTN